MFQKIFPKVFQLLIIHISWPHHNSDSIKSTATSEKTSDGIGSDQQPDGELFEVLNSQKIVLELDKVQRERHDDMGELEMEIDLKKMRECQKISFWKFEKKKM